MGDVVLLAYLMWKKKVSLTIARDILRQEGIYVKTEKFWD